MACGLAGGGWIRGVGTGGAGVGAEAGGGDSRNALEAGTAHDCVAGHPAVGPHWLECAAGPAVDLNRQDWTGAADYRLSRRPMAAGACCDTCGDIRARRCWMASRIPNSGAKSLRKRVNCHRGRGATCRWGRGPWDKSLRRVIRCCGPTTKRKWSECSSASKPRARWSSADRSANSEASRAVPTSSKPR